MQVTRKMIYAKASVHRWKQLLLFTVIKPHCNAFHGERVLSETIFRFRKQWESPSGHKTTTSVTLTVIANCGQGNRRLRPMNLRIKREERRSGGSEDRRGCKLFVGQGAPLNNLTSRGSFNEQAERICLRYYERGRLTDKETGNTGVTEHVDRWTRMYRARYLY